MKKGILPALLVVVSQIMSCAHNPAPTPVDYQPPASSSDDKRTPSSSQDGTPWTDWSKKKSAAGLIVLSHIRDNLLKNSLHDPHVNYSGYSPVTCTSESEKFRSADGTCNDLSKPHAGAAGVAFGRNVHPKYIDKDAAKKLMTPNPALVSKEFFTRSEFKPVPFLNMLAGVWIQFMNHDWLTHGRNMDSNDNPHKVAGVNGEVKSIDRTKENRFSSSQYKKSFDIVTTNDVTHWWDGSQLYGSSQEEQNKVRSFFHGRMKTVNVNGRELLPKDANLNVADNKQNQGYEVTGFRDNWWVGLSMLHTLFVKEHNAIAAKLMQKHAGYDPKINMWTWKNKGREIAMNEKELDEIVFQTARLVNSAVMAKIHTVEWTPAILSNDTLKKGMYANWYGIANPETLKNFGLFKNITQPGATDWFESIDLPYLVGGIVGNKTKNYGVPFSITEEFTSVYRLHSLLPETLNLKRMKKNSVTNHVPFLDTRNEKSYGIMADYDLQDLYYSFGKQHPGMLELNNFPKFMQELTIPGHGSIDLGMVDVIRDRERGVPRYNQFRRAIGLIPITAYTDFFLGGKAVDARQHDILAKFNRVYGKNSAGKDNVEMIDLLVGTLAEEVRPDMFGFGETMFQIFILMASRRLMADRFFTDGYTEENYTKTGKDWIDNEGTFAQVIVRHMPLLKPQVKGLETAFRPWTNEYRAYATKH